MPNDNKSLILQEQAELNAAPFLFSEDQLPKIDKAKPKFHCTGDRLFRDRPDVYKALVKLLAEPGVSVRTICTELHVSDHTVRSVANREGIAIATVKKEVLANVTHGMRLASERVIELMPEASARDALIGVGILGDKMTLLSGEPMARIEIGPQINVGEALQRLIDETTERLRLREQVVEHAVERVKQLEARLNDLDEKSGAQNALKEDAVRQLIELKQVLAPNALINGEDQRPCHDCHGATDAVIDVNATLVGDASESNAGEAI